MIPNIFLEINKLPIKPNGKIDKKAIPIPKNLKQLLLKQAKNLTYVEPKNELEKKICSILTLICGIEKISIEQNIEELGINSLQSLRFISECKKLGIYIGLADLKSSISSLTDNKKL